MTIQKHFNPVEHLFLQLTSAYYGHYHPIAADSPFYDKVFNTYEVPNTELDNLNTTLVVQPHLPTFWNSRLKANMLKDVGKLYALGFDEAQIAVIAALPTDIDLRENHLPGEQFESFSWYQQAAANNATVVCASGDIGLQVTTADGEYAALYMRDAGAPQGKGHTQIPGGMYAGGSYQAHTLDELREESCLVQVEKFGDKYVLAPIWYVLEDEKTPPNMGILDNKNYKKYTLIELSKCTGIAVEVLETQVDWAEPKTMSLKQLPSTNPQGTISVKDGVTGKILEVVHGHVYYQPQWRTMSYQYGVHGVLNQVMNLGAPTGYLHVDQEWGREFCAYGYKGNFVLPSLEGVEPRLTSCTQQYVDGMPLVVPQSKPDVTAGPQPDQLTS